LATSKNGQDKGAVQQAELQHRETRKPDMGKYKARTVIKLASGLANNVSLSAHTAQNVP
jgi:hypothetical protein